METYVDDIKEAQLLLWTKGSGDIQKAADLMDQHNLKPCLSGVSLTSLLFHRGSFVHSFGLLLFVPPKIERLHWTLEFRPVLEYVYRQDAQRGSGDICDIVGPLERVHQEHITPYPRESV